MTYQQPQIRLKFKLTHTFCTFEKPLTTDVYVLLAQEAFLPDYALQALEIGKLCNV